MNNTNSLVFIRSMQFLGGHLVTYPLLRQIKRLYPDDDLIVAGTDPVAQHYESTPWVDQYIRADTAMEKLRASTRAARTFVLHYSSEQYAPIACMARVPVRLGFRNRRVTDFLWTHSHKKTENEYMGLANLELLRTLADFDPEAVARDAIQEFSRDCGRSHTAATDIVLMPGGGAGAYKRWHIDSFIALIEPLKAHMGPSTTFSFVVGPDEQPEAEAIRALGRGDVRIIQNQPMPTIARLVLNARLTIANDCGPSHLAQNACGPYIGLFHDANPQWFWQRHNSVALTPNRPSRNIQDITIEQVIQAALSLLGARIRRAA